MSAFAGVLRFDDAPLDIAWLAHAGAALSRVGPDGGHEVKAGPIGMTYRAFHITPESPREVQPALRPGIGLLTWDGRLDNRDDLRRALGDRVATDATDVDYVWSAYERWGAAAFARLIGDFALALWDARVRTLWFARDSIGARTLYYHVNAQRCVWSTDLGVLLQADLAPLEVDDEYIAGFLCRGPDVHRTPYVNVRSVRPAHAVMFRDGASGDRELWALEPDREIRYATDGEYEEHFRQLFRESARARLRSPQAVFAELSGGLDSSSIVCMASSLIRAGDVVASRLQTISYVFDDCETVDDSRWIAHVERHLGSRTIRVRGEEHPYLTAATETSRFATLNPALIHSAYVSSVADHMHRAGARLLLSGVGGDEVLHSRNNPDPELGDLLYRRQLRALCCRTFTWSRLLRQPYAHLLWRGAIWPMLPAGLRATVPGAHRRVPVWVAPEFARRSGLARRMVDTPEVAAFKQPSARYQAAGFLSAVKQIAAGHRQELGEFHTTYPYLDRRLVEFLQAVPFEQKVRPGESRSLMRRALRHLLPREIAARRGKSSPSEATARAFAREWPRLRSLLEDGLLVDRGYADGRKLREALVHARTGWTGSAHLTSAVLLECWLRTLDDRRARAVDRIAAAGSPALAVAVCDGAAPRPH